MTSKIADSVQHSGGSGERIQVGEGCPICLEPITGEAFLDQCFHRFCYHCILQWSEMVLAASVKKSGNPKRVAPLECPYCKTLYTSIIYDFVSGTSYQRDFLLASDGSQFRLSEAHRRRKAVYASRGPKEILEPKSGTSRGENHDNSSELRRPGSGRGEVPQVSKTRNVQGVVKANKWLICWVRRELQALMQDEDVEMVTHHVVGVVESLQKRPRVLSTKDNEKGWHDAVAAAARPFVFENAEKFAEELWKFLDAGVDIAFYDQKNLDSPTGPFVDEITTSSAAPQGYKMLEILDEDVED